MKSTRRHFVVAVTAAAAVAVSAAGCGSTSSTSSTSSAASRASVASASANPITLKVAYAQGTEANFYYALDKGLFKRAGINIKPVVFDSGPSLVAAVESGSVDIGYAGEPPVLASDSRGANLQIWAVTDDSGPMDALYTSPSSGITSVKGLVGKTVATTQNTVPDVMLLLALQQAGVNPSSVHIENLAPPAIYAAYVHGDINAAWIFNGIGAKLISDGARIRASATSIGYSDAGVWMANKSYIPSHVAALRRFLKVIDTATPITNTSAAATDYALTTSAGLTPAEAGTVAKYELNSNLLSSQLGKPSFRLALTPGGSFSKQLTKEEAVMLKVGMIPSAPDPNNVVTCAVVCQ